jgi:aryl-alcohol dehydrogenase-like predicted oxidoreductase
MAKALNLGVLAWSPLANGVLTGKYHSEGKAEAGRMSRQEMQESGYPLDSRYPMESVR